MSNPTNTPNPARPTPDTAPEQSAETPSTEAPSTDSTETRPLTGPTLVLPELFARETGPTGPTGSSTPTLTPPAAASAATETTATATTSAEAPATAPAAATPPAAPFAWEQPAASARHRPRFATILWGALLLGFAVFMAAWTLFPGTLDPTLWLLAAVIGVGLVLVIAGIAAATRRTD
ncbi:hypothetical protein D6T64_19955 [Cryobacterium melibiosiphilum]|uniref:Uncharacterized protein n=1 Tax=Cryobacterium melibiosiphilum TaxID=995039 RepID=A0A3A5ML57_9MICO|nr:hypothetical protein [Cryobacterium melibiosiphilum]RJT85197.1 hypothetical protein D6T64_19955 [Cryobacterium melibiosiphilum]